MRAEARVAVRLLLEHHPLCHVFAADRLRVFGVTVCSGCLAAVPGVAIGFAAALALVLDGVPAWPILAAGLTLGIPQLGTYLHRGSRPWRFAAKAVGGIGLGAVAMAALVLPVPKPWLVAGSTTLLVAFAGLQALRVRSILRTCDACPYRRDWANCPGFQSLPRMPAAGFASWSDQSRPKSLKAGTDTPSRHAGPAHRG